MKILAETDSLAVLGAGVAEYEGYILWDHDCSPRDKDAIIAENLQAKSGKAILHVFTGCGPFVD
jgi:hypothetical protein